MMIERGDVMIFTFIENPQTVSELIYNLFLFDSILFVLYVSIKEICHAFYLIRKNFRKGER